MIGQSAENLAYVSATTSSNILTMSGFLCSNNGNNN